MNDRFYVFQKMPWWHASDERVQGDCFSMVGFLGLTVLSGGLGRVTPAVGLDGEKPLPLRYLGRA